MYVGRAGCAAVGWAMLQWRCCGPVLHCIPVTAEEDAMLRTLRWAHAALHKGGFRAQAGEED